MGLWTVMPERLESPACRLYNMSLQMMAQGAKETISVLHKPVDVFGGVVPNLKPSERNESNAGGNAEVSSDRNATQRKTNGGLLPKVSIFG